MPLRANNHSLAVCFRNRISCPGGCVCFCLYASFLLLSPAAPLPLALHLLLQSAARPCAAPSVRCSCWLPHSMSLNSGGSEHCRSTSHRSFLQIGYLSSGLAGAIWNSGVRAMNSRHLNRLTIDL